MVRMRPCFRRFEDVLISAVADEKREQRPERRDGTLSLGYRISAKFRCTWGQLTAFQNDWT